MRNVLFAIVPACISFGPLFMTGIGRAARTDAGDKLVIAGVFMLAAGLGVMFSTILAQQKLIEKLQAERIADGTATPPSA